MSDTIVFGIETNKTDESLKYFTDTQKRMKDTNFINNPFKGIIKIFLNKDKIWNVFILKPIYPDLSFIGLFIIGASYLLGGFQLNIGVYIGIGFILLMSFFWSKYFFYTMMRLGLMKAKYKGKVSLISNKELVKRVVEYAD
jgi:hypothetical protein